MRIEVRVSMPDGWRKFRFDAPEGSDAACYALLVTFFNLLTSSGAVDL